MNPNFTRLGSASDTKLLPGSPRLLNAFDSLPNRLASRVRMPPAEVVFDPACVQVTGLPDTVSGTTQPEESKAESVTCATITQSFGWSAAGLGELTPVPLVREVSVAVTVPPERAM